MRPEINDTIRYDTIKQDDDGKLQRTRTREQTSRGVVASVLRIRRHQSANVVVLIKNNGKFYKVIWISEYNQSMFLNCTVLGYQYWPKRERGEYCIKGRIHHSTTGGMSSFLYSILGTCICVCPSLLCRFFLAFSNWYCKMISSLEYWEIG